MIWSIILTRMSSGQHNLLGKRTIEPKLISLNRDSCETVLVLIAVDGPIKHSQTYPLTFLVSTVRRKDSATVAKDTG